MQHIHHTKFSILSTLPCIYLDHLFPQVSIVLVKVSDSLKTYAWCTNASQFDLRCLSHGSLHFLITVISIDENYPNKHKKEKAFIFLKSINRQQSMH